MPNDIKANKHEKQRKEKETKESDIESHWKIMEQFLLCMEAIKND